MGGKYFTRNCGTYFKHVHGEKNKCNTGNAPTGDGGTVATTVNANQNIRFEYQTNI